MFDCFSFDGPRAYKRGFIEGRKYTRKYPNDPIIAREHVLVIDDYDRGWDAGVKSELKFQEKKLHG